MPSVTILIIVGVLILFIIGRRRFYMSNQNVKNVSASEANSLINDNKDILILDVRTKEEYDGGHIPGAVLIPVQQLNLRINELEKDKPVLVYCASGGRSPGAVQTLVKNDFSQIYHLSRGIMSWPYKIERKN